MFIAIAFVCFVTNECRFIQDKEVVTKQVCQERNEAVSQIFEANPRVTGYETACVEVHFKKL